jgi:hypothetical protein
MKLKKAELRQAAGVQKPDLCRLSHSNISYLGFGFINTADQGHAPAERGARPPAAQGRGRPRGAEAALPC